MKTLVGLYRANRAVGCALLLTMAMAAALPARGDNFQKPTKEELEMRSLPGYPGAPALVLFREQITNDDLHSVQNYERIKILTEDGKKYANVELGFVTTRDIGGEYAGDDKTVEDITGRTIHADGTIIPFTGKPYLKTVDKGEYKEVGYAFQEKVFTLPDVEVGSIIEYRYATRYSDSAFEAPDWFIQGDLYLKAAHYAWFPTSRELIDADSSLPVNAISWFPILPEGAKIAPRMLPASSPSGRSHYEYELTIKDVPPSVHEEFMPPIASFSYRVLFNFTPFVTSAEYWKSKGKSWSKTANNFAAPNSELLKATQDVLSGASSEDDKLRRIYATVMTVENTKFTRAHAEREDKADGHRVMTAADVLANKRGTATQVAELFVGMARAAGMKAYLMLVPDREKALFTPMWQNFSQFDDVIAIVNVDGKEQFFDPGERYCKYGHLAWQHMFVQGLRQVEGGTNFATTPGDDYIDNKTSRVANLSMDEQGEVSGQVDLTFLGAPALTWRQTALKGDDESLRRQLRETLEEMLPKSLEVKVANIENLTDYEKPLLVHYNVTGTAGAPTGKRLMMPADLFLSGEKATFPLENRELAVYFHYPQIMQDALRVKLPKTLTVEAVPDPTKADIPKSAAYNMNVTTAANSFTTRRNYIMGEIIVPAKDYASLREFYSHFESKDKESVVLKQVVPGVASVSAPDGR